MVILLDQNKILHRIPFNVHWVEGGEGKPGKVLELRGWDKESGHSVAYVQWATTGCTNVYRVGHKGKVDLKYIQESNGGFYYKDHLPVLGESDEELKVGIENLEDFQTKGLVDEQIVSCLGQLSINENSNQFSVDDKVKIIMPLETFKIIQEGHGGWNQNMADVCGRSRL
jgi:E3 ubiquitin-protein ligase mind-bomb